MFGIILFLTAHKREDCRLRPETGMKHGLDNDINRD
ncbi:Calcium uniporter protein [Psidium guajava]|nr:Calcium uniporter protein [Psidium guajava]